MIDTNRLEKIFNSWKKVDNNSYQEFINMLVNEHGKIATGLFTVNEYENIRFLQGFGSLLNIILSVADKVNKNQEV